MVKKSIKPGRVFWVGTFMIGVFSPGKGKRRVNDRMKRVDADWRKAQTRIGALEDELATAYAEIRRLTKGTAGGPHVRRPRSSKRLAGSEAPFTVSFATTATETDREETVPLPKADPGLVLVRRLSDTAGAADLPGGMVSPEIGVDTPVVPG